MSRNSHCSSENEILDGSDSDKANGFSMNMNRDPTSFSAETHVKHFESIFNLWESVFITGHCVQFPTISM